MYLSFRPLRATYYLRYVLASAISLSADMLVFVMATSLGVAAVPAAVLGYVCGLVVHWVMSSRFVFPWTVQAGWDERVRKQFLFVISALAGLGITTGVIHWGTHWGFDPLVAKIAAICLSFQATYLIRKRVVFS